MGKTKSSRGAMSAAYFGLALGAGVLVGAGIAVALLEIREYTRKTLALAKRERDIARMMVDVIGDISGFAPGSLPGRGTGLGPLGGNPEVQERIRQRLKAKLRKGDVGMADSERTREMDGLYVDMMTGADGEEAG